MEQIFYDIFGKCFQKCLENYKIIKKNLTFKYQVNTISDILKDWI